MAITTLKQAQTALTQHRALLAEIAFIERREKLDAKRKKAAKLKDEVTVWAVESETDTIELENAHATLVRQSYGSRWVSTEDDQEDGDPAYVVPLSVLLERKFGDSVGTKGSKARKVWMRLTKRIADFKLIEAAVSEGLVAIDDISSAFVQKDKKPYLRVFDD